MTSAQRTSGTLRLSVLELLHKPTHLKWNQVLATAFAFYHVVPHYGWSLTKTTNFNKHMFQFRLLHRL